MRQPTRSAPRRAPSSSVVTTLFAVAALASAVYGASIVVPQLDDWRETYGKLDPEAREEAVVRSLRFDPTVWERIDAAVDADDRFNVVSEQLEQHEVRNYAAYALLPAVQVADAGDADVVLYWKSEPPSGRPCATVTAGVCVVRRQR